MGRFEDTRFEKPKLQNTHVLLYVHIILIMTIFNNNILYLSMKVHNMSVIIFYICFKNSLYTVLPVYGMMIVNIHFKMYI